MSEPTAVEFVDGKCRFEQDGFQVVARVEHDQYMEPDEMLGKFTSDWQEGAIDHHAKGCSRPRDHHRWFVPEMSYEDHRKSLHNMGKSKAEADRLAREYVEADYQRADSFGDEWWYTTMVVTVYREGVELGDDNLGGIESDSDPEYLASTLKDLVDQAIAMAQGNLVALEGPEPDSLFATIEAWHERQSCSRGVRR